jgi:hypothetical protein
MQSHTNLQAAGNPICWALSWSHAEARRLGARILAFLTTCADLMPQPPCTKSCPGSRMLSSNAGAYLVETFTGTSFPLRPSDELMEPADPLAAHRTPPRVVALCNEGIRQCS